MINTLHSNLFLTLSHAGGKARWTLASGRHQEKPEVFRINPGGHGCRGARGELGRTRVWETGASNGDRMVLPLGRAGCRPVPGQPTSDSDDMPSSQTESNPFFIYDTSSLKPLVSGAPLPDGSEAPGGSRGSRYICPSRCC